MPVEGKGAKREAVAETISVDDTVQATFQGDGDYTELRQVDRDNYVIGEEIAKGGMGVILAARDRRTGREVAIKEVRADVMTRIPALVHAAVLRFKREALLSAQLQHPGIIPVYEVGRFDDTPFIAMKRIHGTPLNDVLADAESDDDRLALLPTLIAVADALAYAHSEGVVHRDIKPANIIVGDFGETVVIDWGLAKRGKDADESINRSPPSGDALETVAGSVFGTPQYMSPEQAEGKRVGRRSDVYAIGALLYELLAGEAPYESSIRDSSGKRNAAKTIELVREGPPTAIAEIDPEAPTDLVSIANKAMARDPSDRYATAAELAEDLRAFERGQLVDVHDYSTAELVRRWISRHRGVVITAALLLIFGAASTAWFVNATVNARHEAEVQEDRAATELRKAMEETRDRGIESLGRGELHRAAVELSTAYRHLGDRPLRAALGEVMRSVEPFESLLFAQPRGIPDMAVDRFNNRVAFGDSDRTVVATFDGKKLFEVPGSKPHFTASGERLLTHRRAATLVWDSTGRKVFSVEQSDISQLTSDADSHILLGIHDTRYVIGYSALTGEQLFEIRAPGALLTIPRVAADNRTVVAFAPNPIILDLETSRVTYEFTKQNRIHVARGLPIAFSPNGRLGAVSVLPGRVTVFQVADPKNQLSLNVLGRSVVVLAFTSDNQSLISLDYDGGLCFSSLTRSSDTRCYLDANATSLSVFENRVTTGHANGTVSVWHFDGSRLGRLAAHARGPALATFAGGDRVVTAGADGAARLWRIDELLSRQRSSQTQRSSIEGHYLVSRGSGTVTIAKAMAPEETLEIPSDRERPQIVGSMGKHLFVDKEIWDFEARRKLPLAELNHAAASALAPDGTLAAVVHDHQLRVISLDARKTLWTLRLDDTLGVQMKLPLYSLGFSPSGTKVAVRSLGVDVVFDSQTGRTIARRTHGSKGSATVSRQLVFANNEESYVSTANQVVTAWSPGGVARELGTFAFPRITPHRDGVIIADNYEIAVASSEVLAGRGELEWLKLSLMPASTLGEIQSSSEGFIATSTLGGSVYVFDHAGRLFMSRHVPDANGLTFLGDSLFVNGPRQTLRIPMKIETRPPSEISKAVERLTNPSKPVLE